jgi:transposase
VRLIDPFVELSDISKVDFAAKTLKTEGRPSFNSKVFLKMCLYGYLKAIRSGRDLEKECFRNMEMQWFL